ncbi:MAG: hypothetical protein EBU46_01420 [Nitrosomonadaceae bacterium]|nr:hypothetical protein [Nitrosomonadaceae bacterium]
MGNKVIFIAAICLLLFGCAGPILTKPGVTEAQAAKDNRECNFEGVQYAHQMGMTGNFMVIGDYRAGCLRDRGYQ